MMDSPFYRSHTDIPSRPRSVREIPVQFVGPERKEIPSGDRSESAVKIQKVLRGFLVRKSVKKIAEIRAEVEQIEKRMSEEEMVELIGRDSKERLRVNETLMNLLFKLDSVRGVDSGVRDCRKAVIKRAIALQERLDSVACNSNRSNENVDRTVEDDHDDVDRTSEEECTEVACDSNGNNENVDRTVEDDDVDRTVKEECTEFANDGVVHDCCPEESVGTNRTESRSGSSSSVDPQSLVEPREDEEDDASSLKQEKNDVGIEDKGDNMKESKEESVRKRELLLEKMVEDNEKMMELMAQLFERNAMQTRLLSSLSQRVEQLERAYLCDRLRRKKKRQAATGAETVDWCGGDMSPDVKKCGKR